MEITSQTKHAWLDASREPFLASVSTACNVMMTSLIKSFSVIQTRPELVYKVIFTNWLPTLDPWKTP